jgi:hypothetical protein
MADRFNEPPYDPRLDPHHPRFDPRFEPREDPRFGGDYDPRMDPRYDYGPDNRDPRDVPPPPPPPQSGRPYAAPPPGPAPRRSRGRGLLILGGLLGLLLVAFFAYRLTRAGPGEDRLDENANSASASDTATAEQRCGSQRTYDLVKQQLFRQAAQTRGTDQSTFDRLSAYAAIRVTNPVLKREDEELGTLVCSGNVALDLPPGVAVVGGRSTLQASLDYSLQPAADGSGDVVTLSNADGIVVPLATLARTGTQPGLPQQQDQQQAPSPNAGDYGQPTDAVRPSAPQAPSAPPPPARPPVSREPDRAPPPPRAESPSASIRPSFNCARARTRGEVAVCRSPELASLDRQMARFFYSARREADPQARAQLERTRGRFLAFRDRCGSDRCIADAYRGRITEIRDIVDGRWQPQ